MTQFVGRGTELAFLRRTLQRVETTPPGERPGQCLLIRGRRRVGKSRLVETFIEQIAAPHLYYTAAREPLSRQLAQLRDDARVSTLPARDLLEAATPEDWAGAFRLLASTLPSDRPSVVIMDEVPYLMDAEGVFESALQRAWDRELQHKPVLLILIGSDLAMMEALGSYGRPFHQRGREMVLGPLTPADVQDMLDLSAADAFDATLLTGGLPLICTDWPQGAGMWDFIADSVSDPISALLVSGERSLAAEFPDPVLSRTVLGAIGSGERSFGNIARAAGNLASTSLQRALQPLIDKRLVAAELPLSTRASKERRYRVTDPYLQFWLRFLEPHMPYVERGRGDLVVDAIARSWNEWRGRAIEPFVRDALAKLIPDDVLPAAPQVGSYWTRKNDIEIDVVGADRAPVADTVLFVGSIKWKDNAAFDDHDLAALLRHRALLTDELVPAIAVSRNGMRETGPELARAYAPDDLIRAWRD